MSLFQMPSKLMPHPARYTDRLLPVFARMLREHKSKRVLDPMCGTGKVFLLDRFVPGLEIEGVEIEPEWAAHNPRTTLGSALDLPWPAGYFDAVVVSPAYGNRMADARSRSEDWSRISYADSLGRDLHVDNGGALQWGHEYRVLHLKAWTEAKRVLRPGGIFILNCKNHIRAGEVQYVTEWHVATLEQMEFVVLEWERVPCPGMRRGANSELRVQNEDVVLLRYDSPEYKGE